MQHTHILRYVSPHPTQCLAVTAAQDGSLAVWNVAAAATAQTEHKSPEPSDRAKPVLFIPNAHGSGPVYKCFFRQPHGDRIVSSGQDGTVAVHSFPEGKLLFRFQASAPVGGGVRGLSLSQCGTFAASGCDLGFVKVWDIEDGKTRNKESFLSRSSSSSSQDDGTTRHSSWCRSVSVSHCGRKVVSGSDDFTVRIWSTNVKKATDSSDDDTNDVIVCRGHTAFVRCVAATARGLAVSASDDSTVKLWNLLTGTLMYTLLGHSATSAHMPWIRTLAVSSDGTFAVTGAYDATVRVWPLETFSAIHAEATTLATSTLHADDIPGAMCLKSHPNWIRSVAVSPDCTRIFSGSYDMTVRQWDRKTGQLLAVGAAHDDIIMHVSCTSDSRFALTASTDLTAMAWTTARDVTEQQTIRPAAIFGGTNMILAVAFSRCGRFVISASADHLVRVYDASGRADGGSFSLVARLQGHTGWVRCVDSIVLSVPAADEWFIVSGSSDCTCRIWKMTETESNTATAQWKQQQLLSLQHPLQVISLSVAETNAADNTAIIVTGCGDQRVRKWRVSLEPHQQDHVTLLQTYAGHTGWIRGVAVTSDLKHIVSSSGDQTCRVWPYRTETEQISTSTASASIPSQQLIGHVHIIPGLTAIHNNSPRQQQHASFAVSSSYDKTMRLWSTVDCGPPVTTFRGHTSWVRCVAFCPAGVIPGSTFDTVILREGKEQVLTTPDGLEIVETQDEPRPPVAWKCLAVLGDEVAAVTADRNDDKCDYSGYDTPAALISCSYDGTVRVWPVDLDRYEIIRKEQQARGERAFVAQKDLIPYRAGADYMDKHETRFADERRAAEYFKRTFKHPGAVLCVAVNPRNGMLVSGCDDGKVRLWHF